MSSYYDNKAQCYANKNIASVCCLDEADSIHVMLPRWVKINYFNMCKVNLQVFFDTSPRWSTNKQFTMLA